MAYTRKTNRVGGIGGDIVYAADINDMQIAAERRVPGVLVAASDAPASWDGAEYVCDGTADDVQIQAALDADLGPVHLSPGTFSVATSIVIDRDHVHLTGSGWDTTLQAATNLNGPVVTNTQPTGDYRFGLRIERLRIDGNAANQSSGGAIKLLGTYYAVIDHVQLWAPRAYGIWIDRDGSEPFAAYNFIQNFDIYGGALGSGVTRAVIGIETSATDFNTIGPGTIDWFDSVGGIGLKLGGWNQKVSNVHVDACETCLLLDFVETNLIDNCSFDRATLCAIDQNGGKGNRIRAVIGVYTGVSAGTLPSVDISGGASTVDNVYELSWTGSGATGWKYGVQEAASTGANSYVGCVAGSGTFATAFSALQASARKAVCGTGF